MNDNKVKIFEYLDILVKMCRSKGNGASLRVEEEDIYKKINEYDSEIEELNTYIQNDCYDASAEMADRNIEIITKKIIKQLRLKNKLKNRELDDLKARENDYNSQIQILKKNKKSNDEYRKSLEKRADNCTDYEVKNKYEESINAVSVKLEKVSKELESKNLEYTILQTTIEEYANEIRKTEQNIATKEALLEETQNNLKNKESYLDQTKIEKYQIKIDELEIKKKKLNNRLKEIKENTQYLLTKIKEDINENRDVLAYKDDVINLIKQAHQIPYMNVEANKNLEEELLKATQERDSFALEIDQKNYSLLETFNPNKIRIDHLKEKIENWTQEKEELRGMIYNIDNDKLYNYQVKYDQLSDILDTMKKELSEFETAYENDDEINLSTKANLKLSIEEKKQEIFETEHIMSLFRKEESVDIDSADKLYKVEFRNLEIKIAEAEAEIENIKSHLLARKSGLIDISTQNRDKEKLKELAVKVIDIKHRRQFAERPLAIAKKLEELLGTDLVTDIDDIVVEEPKPELSEVKVIVSDSSVRLNDMDEMEEQELPTVESITAAHQTKKEYALTDFELIIPPVRGIKVVSQEEIANPTEETVEKEETPIVIPEAKETASIVEPEEPEIEHPEEDKDDDVISFAEPEDNQPVELDDVIEITSNVQETQNTFVEDDDEDDTILAIEEIFKETSSQKDDKHDNINLSGISDELDQYITDFDLPN